MKELLHLVPLQVSSLSGRHDDTSCNLSDEANPEFHVQPVERVGGVGVNVFKKHFLSELSSEFERDIRCE